MLGHEAPRQFEFGLCVLPVPDSSAHRLLSRIDELVDFEVVRPRVAPYFAALGRPSIDPVVMVKMMVVGYLFGIESDRELVAQCEDRLSFREFLGLNLSDPVPVHATFTHWRQRLGPEVFRGLLHALVSQCVAHGMKLSPVRTLDATSVKAQADKHGPVVPVPAEAEAEDIERHLKAVFLDEVPEAADGQKWVPINLHDPDARLQTKDQTPAEFRYQVSLWADPETGLIADATATPTEQPETAVDHLAHDPYPVTEFVADARYDDGDTLVQLQTDERQTYVPKTKRDKPGTLSKDRFVYDPEANRYQCPAGHWLTYAGFNRHSRLHQYVARKSDCAGCALKAECTTARRRTVTRTVNEAARERCVRAGPRYDELMRQRRIMEHLHGVGKRDHALRRARGLGLAAMRIQAALTAAAINILKLVRWSSKPGPHAALSHALCYWLGLLWVLRRLHGFRRASGADPGGLPVDPLWSPPAPSPIAAPAANGGF